MFLSDVLHGQGSISLFLFNSSLLHNSLLLQKHSQSRCLKRVEESSLDPGEEFVPILSENNNNYFKESQLKISQHTMHPMENLRCHCRNPHSRTSSICAILLLRNLSQSFGNLATHATFYDGFFDVQNITQISDLLLFLRFLC